MRNCAFPEKEKKGNSRYFKLLIAALSLLLCNISSTKLHAQFYSEKGTPPVYSYTAKEYKAMSQNWDIVQDVRGVMYFANNGGILEFDGVNWRLIKVSNNTNVRSFAIDEKGKIYVGAENDFGFLAPDSVGRMSYHTLLDHLNEKDKDFGDVWKVVSVKDGIYFQSTKKIFHWDGKVIKTWEAEHSFHILFKVHETLYVRQKNFGLTTFKDNRIVLVKGGDAFSNEGIRGMVPYGDNEVLIVTMKRGMYMMHLDDNNDAKSITHVPTRIDDFLIDNVVKNAVRLNDKLVAIGTEGAGVVIIDESWDIVQLLNKHTGLHDEIINNQYVDDHNNLWLALSNGLARVEYSSPVTVFNEQAGLEGTIESVLRHKGVLYVGTHTGVYYLASGKNKGAVNMNMNETHANGISIFKPKLIPISGILTECWNLLSFNHKEDSLLLIALNDGIYQLQTNGTISSIVKNYPWMLTQQKQYPERVFIGLDDGISSIYRKDGKWVNEDRIGAIEETIRNIEEDNDGTLYLATNNQGLIKMKIKSYVDNEIDEIETERLDTSNGLPQGFVFYYQGKKWSLFASENGLYTFNKNENRFYPDTILGKQFTTQRRGIHRLNEDHQGNLWMVTFINDQEIEVGVASPNIKDVLMWRSTPFLEISKDIIHAIYHDTNGVTWLGGPEGLFRYDSKVEKDYKMTYYTTIRTVSTSGDSTVFWGANYGENEQVQLEQPEILKAMLPYSCNSLIFEFAAPEYVEKATNLFSYYLEGFDKEWSEWKRETKAVFTNLHEGTYYFKVKAKNSYRHESKEAVYEFTILPPWYRTIWAYIAYVLLFVGFVWGAITVSTRSLKSIIRERTAEIVHQKDEIEEKNKDIMDSINYAQRIQAAILPPEGIVRLYLRQSFVYYKPKDVVAGDFYWLEQAGDSVLFAAADCTGHGVPGAMVSVVCHNALNNANKEFKLTEPAAILDKVNEIVTEQFATGEQTMKDGMDIALISLNVKTREMVYSGANNPLYYIQDGELKQIKANKQPIGSYAESTLFKSHTLQLNEGDSIYIFSDGFADQFGGAEGKKFKYRPFRELLLSIQDKPMKEQRAILDEAFERWRGDMEQVDDICVIGVKV